MFIEIDKKLYIKAKDVLYIFSSKQNKSIEKIKREAKQNKQYYGRMSGYKALVVTIDKDVYAVNYEPQELIKSCNLNHQEMLVVSSDYAIATEYIKALIGEDCPLAEGTNSVIKATDSLQLVYQRERRKSVARIKTKEIVYLSKDSEELVNSVSGVTEDTSSR